MGIKPTSIKDLRYFTTPEHECSYLEGKRSTTLFADPEAIISTERIACSHRLDLEEVGNTFIVHTAKIAALAFRCE